MYHNGEAIEGAPRMVGMALPWRQIGMNTSIQYLAVGDRRVHRELSEMVVCSALTMAYHGIITQQVTTRSIARVNQRLCGTLVLFARRQWIDYHGNLLQI